MELRSHGVDIRKDSSLGSHCRYGGESWEACTELRVAWEFADEGEKWKDSKEEIWKVCGDMLRCFRGSTRAKDNRKLQSPLSPDPNCASQTALGYRGVILSFCQTPYYRKFATSHWRFVFKCIVNLITMIKSHKTKLTSAPIVAASTTLSMNWSFQLQVSSEHLECYTQNTSHLNYNFKNLRERIMTPEP